jgi:hypothetical protein
MQTQRRNSQAPATSRRALSRGVDWDTLASSKLLSTLTLTQAVRGSPGSRELRFSRIRASPRDPLFERSTVVLPHRRGHEASRQ